jgi:cytochrome P450
MVNRAEPPSVRPDLFGGHFRTFRRDPIGFLTDLARLGDVTTFRMGNQPVFFINHPDLLRDLLVTSQNKFIKGIGLQRTKIFLGEGLLTSEGAFHLRQRRMMQPAFHRERISEYARSMIHYAEKMAEEWSDGEERDIDREMMRLTLAVVGKTLFSADVEGDAETVGHAMNELVGRFNMLLMPYSEILFKLPIPPVLRFRRAKRQLDDLVYGIIKERRASGVDRGDLLSMLLLAQDEEDGLGMSDMQLRDEFMTLFLAGHETTANALTWTFYLLSQNPDAEARLHRELDEVLGDRPPSPDDYGRLRYTESVFAEAMRLYPPAWIIGRSVVEDHTFNGYAIPKGSLVLTSQYVMHRDDRFWERSSEFVPERWEVQSIREAGQRFTYFPFSRGVRSCIGEGFAWMEGVLLIGSLCRRWRLRLAHDQVVGLEPLITLRPRHGMRMTIEQRRRRTVA